MSGHDSVGPGASPPPDASGPAIAGRVVFAGGTVADARVMVIAGPSHPDLAYLSGPDGRFVIAGLTPGLYRLQVAADQGSAQAEVMLSSDGPAHIEITLDPW